MIYTFPKFDWNILQGAVLLSINDENHCVLMELQAVKHKVKIEFDGFHRETVNFDEHGVIDCVSLSQTLGFSSITTVRSAGGNIDDYQQLFIRFKSADDKKEMICTVKNLVIAVD